MPSQDVEALRHIYGHWEKGDWRPRFDIYADDMEWGYSDEFMGIQGVRPESGERSDRLRQWLSPWEDWRASAQYFVVHAETIVVMARYWGSGKGSGVAVDTLGAHVWTFDAGKVKRIVVYSSRDRALRDAGLDPAEEPGRNLAVVRAQLEAWDRDDLDGITQDLGGGAACGGVVRAWRAASYMFRAP